MGDPVQGDEGGRMQLRPRSAHHAHGLGHELVRPRRHRERPRVPSADLLKRGWRGRKPHSDAHDVTWWYGSGCMLSAIQRAPWLLGDARPSPRCILQCMCMVLPTGQAAQRPRAVDSIGLILSSGPRKGWGRARGGWESAPRLPGRSGGWWRPAPTTRQGRAAAATLRAQRSPDDPVSTILYVYLH